MDNPQLSPGAFWHPADDWKGPSAECLPVSNHGLDYRQNPLLMPRLRSADHRAERPKGGGALAGWETSHANKGGNFADRAGLCLHSFKRE